MSSICNHLIRSAQSTIYSAVLSSARLYDYTIDNPQKFLVALSAIGSIARFTFFNPVSTDPDFNIGDHVDLLHDQAVGWIATVIGCGVMKLIQVHNDRSLAQALAQIQIAQHRELARQPNRIEQQIRSDLQLRMAGG